MTLFRTVPGKTVPGIVYIPTSTSSRQGATILPRSFYFVRVRDLDGKPEFDRIYWAETDPEQAEDAKPPYDDVVVNGNVEGRFIYSTALSRHLLPFNLLDPATIVVPVGGRRRELSVLKSDAMEDRGYREFGRWMKEVERVWNVKRGKKADKQTIYERLDYQGELTEQNLDDRYLVLYSTSGTNLSSACVDRDALPLRFLIDHKTYWGTFPTEDEGHFLVAILNSEAVNEIIKPFQSLGLIGEHRVFHKKVLDVPFPQYSKDVVKHRDLVRHAKRAAKEAARAVKLPEFPPCPRQRSYIRTVVEGTLTEINTIVKSLI